MKIKSKKMVGSTNVMRIPKEFQLFGHTYTVKLVDDIYEKENLYGEFDGESKTIRLQKPGILNFKDKKKKENRTAVITDDDLIETFYHEITHAILSSMDERKLDDNEKFVTIFSKSLHQIFKSSI